MTNRLELNWKLDGFVEEQRYYCSETSIDPLNLPTPKAIFAGDVMTYVDTAVEVGKTYHVRVGSVKNEVEKLSDEHIARAGVLWTPLELPTLINLVADNVIVDSSNRVSQLTDINGNNRNAVQASDVRKPILTTIGPLSQKALQFDGSDDFLWISDTTYLQNKNAVWVFWVGEPVFKTAYTSVFYAVYQGTGGSKINFSLNDGKPAFGGRRIVSDSYAEVSSAENISARASINFGQRDYTTKTGALFTDGLQKAVKSELGTNGAADSLDLHGSALGAYVTSSNGTNFSEAYIGKLGCVIVGSGILSEENRQKMEGWAAHKYGLTGNLPPGHPYKTLIPTL
jgi:hypothetical protein